MLQKEETELAKKWINRLTQQSPVYIWRMKVVGNMRQGLGWPDNLLCYYGIMIGIEFKIERKQPTDQQLEKLLNLNRAMGVGLAINLEERAFDVALIRDLNKVIWDQADEYNNGDELLSLEEFMPAWYHIVRSQEQKQCKI